jgi:hypothetical protein
MTGIGEARIRGPLFLVFLVLVGCDDAPGEWAAIVYPDRTDRTRFDVTPRFKTFSYCRDQAIERMKAIQIRGGGDYECGFNASCPAIRTE